MSATDTRPRLNITEDRYLELVDRELVLTAALRFARELFMRMAHQHGDPEATKAATQIQSILNGGRDA